MSWKLSRPVLEPSRRGGNLSGLGSRLGVKFPRSTYLVILCHTKEEAEGMYEKLAPYLEKRGLMLVAEKTRITNTYVITSSLLPPVSTRYPTILSELTVVKLS